MGYFWKIGKRWVVCMVSFTFTTFISANIEAQELNDEENVLQEDVDTTHFKFYHQYSLEHTFNEKAYKSNDLHVKFRPIVSLPIFGVGLNYQINDFTFIGWQTSYGLNREGLSFKSLPTEFNKEYIVYFFQNRKSVVLGLNISESQKLSMTIGLSALFSFGSEELPTIKTNKSLVINHQWIASHSPHIGLEYEYKPSPSKKAKFFYQAVCDLRQKTIFVYDQPFIDQNQKHSIISYRTFAVTAGIRF